LVIVSGAGTFLTGAHLAPGWPGFCTPCTDTPAYLPSKAVVAGPGVWAATGAARIDAANAAKRFTRAGTSSPQPTFARCPWLRGQDRAFERLGQPQIAPQNRQERSKLAVDGTETLERRCFARTEPYVSPRRLPHLPVRGPDVGADARTGTLALPKTAEPWLLTSLREKLIKIGAKVVSHDRYVTFQMAEVAVPRQMFQEILSLIARLRAPPAPA
jgi:hypothetical protein